MDTVIVRRAMLVSSGKTVSELDTNVLHPPRGAEVFTHPSDCARLGTLLEPLEELQHPPRPLGQHLERVLWASCHHTEDRRNEFERNGLVECVAEVVDEDLASTLPT
jgi:hypothetical protein